mgnify:CR=1 FL=1
MNKLVKNLGFELNLIQVSGNKAVSKDDMKQVDNYLNVANFKKKVCVVEGGLFRQDSVKNAIKCSNKKNQIICIHDCVRPFISKSLIKKAIKKCIS